MVVNKVIPIEDRAMTENIKVLVQTWNIKQNTLSLKSSSVGISLRPVRLVFASASSREGAPTKFIETKIGTTC